MLLIWLLLLQAAPPVPPPPLDNLAAALALWVDHPPSPEFRRQAIDAATYSATSRALGAIGVYTGGGIASTARYIEKFDRLRPLIARHLPGDMTEIDRVVDACVVDGIARALNPTEIGEVRTFMATPAGAKFWNYSALGSANYRECYDSNLVYILQASTDDYLAAGLTLPKPPDPRELMGIVY